MRRNLTPGDIRFDPQLEISPFVLFRRFKESRAPVLIDVRPVPGWPSFAGAIPSLPEPVGLPQDGGEAVLFDDDGTRATEIARRLQAAGFTGVRSLFGGLELYDFSLDPAVVGDERFLNEPST
jgi:hypothetical protein